MMNHRGTENGQKTTFKATNHNQKAALVAGLLMSWRFSFILIFLRASVSLWLITRTSE